MAENRIQFKGQKAQRRFDREKANRINSILDNLKNEKNTSLKADKGTQAKEENLSRGLRRWLIFK